MINLPQSQRRRDSLNRIHFKVNRRRSFHEKLRLLALYLILLAALNVCCLHYLQSSMEFGTSWFLYSRELMDNNWDPTEYSTKGGVMPKKLITVIGKESSGTTFVAQTLAEALNLPGNLQKYRDGFFHLERKQFDESPIQVQHVSLPQGAWCLQNHSHHIVEVILPPQCVSNKQRVFPGESNPNIRAQCGALLNGLQLDEGKAELHGPWFMRDIWKDHFYFTPIRYPGRTYVQTTHVRNSTHVARRRRGGPQQQERGRKNNQIRRNDVRRDDIWSQAMKEKEAREAQIGLTNYLAYAAKRNAKKTHHFTLEDVVKETDVADKAESSSETPPEEKALEDDRQKSEESHRRLTEASSFTTADDEGGRKKQLERQEMIRKMYKKENHLPPPGQLSQGKQKPRSRPSRKKQQIEEWLKNVDKITMDKLTSDNLIKYPPRFFLNITAQKLWYDAHGTKHVVVIVVRDENKSFASRIRKHCDVIELAREEEQIATGILNDVIRTFFLQGKARRRLGQNTADLIEEHLLWDPITALQNISAIKKDDIMYSSPIPFKNNIVLVSYEAMIRDRKDYIKELYKVLGIESNYIPVFQDGNAKYDKVQQDRSPRVAKTRHRDQEHENEQDYDSSSEKCFLLPCGEPFAIELDFDGAPLILPLTLGFAALLCSAGVLCLIGLWMVIVRFFFRNRSLWRQPCCNQCDAGKAC